MPGSAAGSGPKAAGAQLPRLSVGLLHLLVQCCIQLRFYSLESEGAGCLACNWYVCERQSCSSEPAGEHAAVVVRRSRAQSLPVPVGVNGEVTIQESIVPGLDFANHANDHTCRWTLWGSRKVCAALQWCFARRSMQRQPSSSSWLGSITELLLALQRAATFWQGSRQAALLAASYELV